jgi:hypothetical protein
MESGQRCSYTSSFVVLEVSATIMRLYLLADLLLFPLCTSSYAAEIMGFMPLFHIRSMGLVYVEYYGGPNAAKAVNDYRLFGIINDAINDTWKARKGITALNGLTRPAPYVRFNLDTT